jgi:hypothetical protein
VGSDHESARRAATDLEAADVAASGPVAHRRLSVTGASP